MFENDIEKLAYASEKKIKVMNRFPPGNLALSVPWLALTLDSELC